ncbi:MAG TPA: oligosaccharide flippase family protein, partial [Thiobacillaceae bacterium]
MVVLQFGIQVVLARLLGPEQYGLFALGLVAVTLSNFLALSFVYGLIQKRNLTDDDLRFVNLWQLTIGAGVAAAVYLLADGVAGFFREARLAPLMEAMAIVCILQALAGIPATLLTRELDFKWLYCANTSSYALAYGMVGIPLAVAGYGVRALVVALIAQNVLSLAVLYWRKPPRLGLLLWHRDAGAFCRYAATVFATNLSNWALQNVGRANVGRLFPSAAVGLYALAYNLAMQLAQAVNGAVQQTLFSASSRMQDELPRQRRVFLTMLAATALLLVPMFAGMAAVPHTITLAFYGDAWADSAPLLRAFALGVPFHIFTAMATPMLWTSGRTTQEYKLLLPMVLALAFATFLAAQHSLTAAAWAACIIFALRCLVMIIAACRALGLGAGEVAGAVRAGIAVSALVAAAVALVDTLLVQLTHEFAVVLACDVSTGFVTQLAALRLFRPWFSTEALGLMEKLIALQL